MRTDQIAYAGIGDEAGASLRAQMDALARLGWSWIELRTVDGIAIADLDELAILTHRCTALGTRYVRVMSYLNAGLAERDWGRRVVDRMRELASRAERAELVLLHENCTGWAGASAERMLELLAEVDSPALRLLFDTGNDLAHGYEAYPMLAEVLPHVAHVHVKDVEGSAACPVYTVPGAGQAGVADCLRLLLRSGYSGVWSIEPHLHLRPHESVPAHGHGDEAGQDRQEGFVASGQALETLVREAVLPAFPAWTAVPGGLRHG